MQAREGEQPPRPARQGSPALPEARYHRCGARHRFAGLSIADGKVSGTSRQRKRFVAVQTVVQQVILPEALQRGVQHVIFIWDHRTTHAPTHREAWLQAQAGIGDLRLHFPVLWLPPNASWLDQIAIWFSILPRKCLPPNPFVATTDLETALDAFLAFSNQQAQPIHWTYTTETGEHKLAQKLGALV
jgi:hypothetical protein